MVKDKVDWYLDELVYEMEQRIGKLVSIPTLWRSLQFCGITRKKIQKAAKERSEALRGFYLYNIGINYTSEQLIFIDEKCIHVQQTNKITVVTKKRRSQK